MLFLVVYVYHRAIEHRQHDAMPNIMEIEYICLVMLLSFRFIISTTTLYLSLLFFLLRIHLCALYKNEMPVFPGQQTIRVDVRRVLLVAWVDIFRQISFVSHIQSIRCDVIFIFVVMHILITVNIGCMYAACYTTHLHNILYCCMLLTQPDNTNGKLMILI